MAVLLTDALTVLGGLFGLGVLIGTVVALVR